MSGRADREVTVPVLVGASTAMSGIGLMLFPRHALRLMGAKDVQPAPLLYRVVGMFMGICGGLLVEGRVNPVVLRWSVLQKTGAVAGVGLGVLSGDYRRRALLVAAFDGASALLLVRALRSRSSS